MDSASHENNDVPLRQDSKYDILSLATVASMKRSTMLFGLGAAKNGARVVETAKEFQYAGKRRKTTDSDESSCPSEDSSLARSLFRHDSSSSLSSSSKNSSPFDNNKNNKTGPPKRIARVRHAQAPLLPHDQTASLSTMPLSPPPPVPDAQKQCTVQLQQTLANLQSLSVHSQPSGKPLKSSKSSPSFKQEKQSAAAVTDKQDPMAPQQMQALVMSLIPQHVMAPTAMAMPIAGFSVSSPPTAQSTVPMPPQMTPVPLQYMSPAGYAPMVVFYPVSQPGGPTQANTNNPHKR